MPKSAQQIPILATFLYILALLKHIPLICPKTSSCPARLSFKTSLFPGEHLHSWKRCLRGKLLLHWLSFFVSSAKEQDCKDTSNCYHQDVRSYGHGNTGRGDCVFGVGTNNCIISRTHCLLGSWYRSCFRGTIYGIIIYFSSFAANAVIPSIDTIMTPASEQAANFFEILLNFIIWTSLSRDSLPWLCYIIWLHTRHSLYHGIMTVYVSMFIQSRLPRPSFP